MVKAIRRIMLRYGEIELREWLGGVMRQMYVPWIEWGYEGEEEGCQGRKEGR